MYDHGPPPWEMKYTGMRGFMAWPVYAPRITARIRKLLAGGLAATLMLRAIAAPQALIGIEDRAAPVQFAADDIEAALGARKYRVERVEEWRVDEARQPAVVVRFATVGRSDD